MDDDFGADADFIAALAASEASPASSWQAPPRRPPQQPTPQRIQRVQQPTHQRLDRAPPSNGSSSGSKIVQPTPQALPQRSAGSSILVSPRQKGNPVIACLKSLPWEYSDIPADYGLGLTTCALFLRFVHLTSFPYSKLARADILFPALVSSTTASTQSTSTRASATCRGSTTCASC